MLWPDGVLNGYWEFYYVMMLHLIWSMNISFFPVVVFIKFTLL